MSLTKKKEVWYYSLDILHFLAILNFLARPVNICLYKHALNITGYIRYKGWPMVVLKFHGNNFYYRKASRK